MNISKQVIILISTILFSIFSLSSCKDKSDDLIPAYIHIDSISFSNTTGLALTNSHAITDAWVYINDNLVGAFELPVTFPVLYENLNSVRIKIQPNL